MSDTPRTDAIRLRHCAEGEKHIGLQYVQLVQFAEAMERELAQAVNGFSDGAKWIPVKERTPEAQYDVLVSDGQFVTIGDCCKGHLWNAQLIGPVTHWMPLPGAPK